MQGYIDFYTQRKDQEKSEGNGEEGSNEPIKM